VSTPALGSSLPEWPASSSPSARPPRRQRCACPIFSRLVAAGRRRFWPSGAGLSGSTPAPASAPDAGFEGDVACSSGRPATGGRAFGAHFFPTAPRCCCSRRTFFPVLARIGPVLERCPTLRRGAGTGRSDSRSDERPRQVRGVYARTSPRSSSSGVEPGDTSSEASRPACDRANVCSGRGRPVAGGDGGGQPTRGWPSNWCTGAPRPRPPRSSIAGRIGSGSRCPWPATVADLPRLVEPRRSPGVSQSMRNADQAV